MYQIIEKTILNSDTNEVQTIYIVGSITFNNLQEAENYIKIIQN